MSLPSLVGKAQTVLGPIDSAELGVTLSHEHLLFDGSPLFMEPAAASDRGKAHQPVDWDILSWLRYHPLENIDNLSLLDEDLAVRELMHFVAAGGRTVVEQSCIGLARDPEGLRRISRLTGLNIIMGTGFYYYHPGWVTPAILAKSIDEMAEEIVRDITEGVGITGVKAGLIGEVGATWPVHEFEERSIRAAVKAQKQTGAPINIHPGRHPEGPGGAVRILLDAGADMTRVAISHIDGRLRTHESRVELTKLGCYLEYDFFGYEGHYPIFPGSVPIDIPSDTERIHEICALADAGYLNQVLISHDVAYKTKLVSYGGWGYAHISNYVVPMMLKRGVSQELIDTLLIENPRRFFSFV